MEDPLRDRFPTLFILTGMVSAVEAVASAEDHGSFFTKGQAFSDLPQVVGALGPPTGQGCPPQAVSLQWGSLTLRARPAQPGVLSSDTPSHGSLLNARVNYLTTAVISPRSPLIKGSRSESMFTQQAFFFNYPNCLETDKDSTLPLCWWISSDKHTCTRAPHLTPAEGLGLHSQ